MGVVVCAKHGRGFMFVCPHVVNAIDTSSPCCGIELRQYPDPEVPELGSWDCWFCSRCITEYALPATGTIMTDDFLNRTSSLYRPMCPGCFRVWREAAGFRT